MFITAVAATVVFHTVFFCSASKLNKAEARN